MEEFGPLRRPAYSPGLTAQVDVRPLARPPVRPSALPTATVTLTPRLRTSLSTEGIQRLLEKARLASEKATRDAADAVDQAGADAGVDELIDDVADAPAPPPPPPADVNAQADAQALDAEILVVAASLEALRKCAISQSAGDTSDADTRGTERILDEITDLYDQLGSVADHADVQPIRSAMQGISNVLARRDMREYHALVVADDLKQRMYAHVVIPFLMLCWAVLALVMVLSTSAEATIKLFALPSMVVIAGYLGGLAASAVRYIKVRPAYLLPEDAFWFAVKPWLGMLAAGLVYGALTAAVLVIANEDGTPFDLNSAGVWLLLSAAFVVGYSDWLFDKVLGLVSQRVSGDATDPSADQNKATTPDPRTRAIQAVAAQWDQELANRLSAYLGLPAAPLNPAEPATPAANPDPNALNPDG